MGEVMYRLHLRMKDGKVPGYQHIADLYRLDAALLASLERMGAKSAENLVAAIEDAVATFERGAHREVGDRLYALRRTVRDDLAAFLEPGCPPPSERLALLADVKRAGLPAGIYLMPVLPYLSDGDGSLDKAEALLRQLANDLYGQLS